MKTLLLLLMLVGATPCFAQSNPAAEFAAGGKKRYRTSGHPKAKGVDLSLEFPKSWRAIEGDRPNVVQKLVSEAGRGLEFVTISIRALPSGVTFTNKDIDETFSADGLKDMAPAGARIIESRRTKIDNQPAGYCVYLIADERANTKMLLRVQHYAVYYSGYLIFVSFSIGDLDRENAVRMIDNKARQFTPLFQLIANSIIIHNQYK
jgi:hypothetical protein